MVLQRRQEGKGTRDRQFSEWHGNWAQDSCFTLLCPVRGWVHLSWRVGFFNNTDTKAYGLIIIYLTTTHTPLPHPHMPWIVNFTIEWVPRLCTPITHNHTNRHLSFVTTHLLCTPLAWADISNSGLNARDRPQLNYGQATTTKVASMSLTLLLASCVSNWGGGWCKFYYRATLSQSTDRTWPQSPYIHPRHIDHKPSRRRFVRYLWSGNKHPTYLWWLRNLTVNPYPLSTIFDRAHAQHTLSVTGTHRNSILRRGGAGRGKLTRMHSTYTWAGRSRLHYRYVGEPWSICADALCPVFLLHNFPLPKCYLRLSYCKNENDEQSSRWKEGSSNEGYWWLC